MNYKPGDNYYELMVASKVVSLKNKKEPGLHNLEDVMSQMIGVSPEEAALHATRGCLYDTTSYDYELTNNIELYA